MYVSVKISPASDNSGSKVPTLHDFGNNVSVLSKTMYSEILVKFDSGGHAKWLKETESTTNAISCIKVDNSDNIYAVGTCEALKFDNIAIPKYKVGSYYNHPLLAKIRPDGTVLYATTALLSASAYAEYNYIYVADNGEIFIVGSFWRNKEFVLDSGLSFTGSPNYNPVIFKYERE